MSEQGTPLPGGHPRSGSSVPGPAPWASRAEAVLSEPALGRSAPRQAEPGAFEPGRSAAGASAAGAPASGRSVAGPGGDPARGGPSGGSRRGAGDPVKALLHRHRELCERAVDPLEIAAGLEAHGLTDRSAARYRHRDVFSLAEELYARVPRGDDDARPLPAAGSEPDTAWNGRAALPYLLPGALGALTAAGLATTGGPLRAAIGAAGAAGLAVALTVCLRRGPLRAGRTARGTRAWTGFLLAYALFGDGLLVRLLAGGPDRPGPPDTAPLLGLALAVAPAAWCAHLFAVRARGRLATSRGVADFAAGARPLLLGVVALHGAVLTGLLALVGAAVDEASLSGAALALGTLLFLARLLAVHGFPRAAAAGLLAAAAIEALAPAAVLAGRLPGCDALARPVRAVVDTWGAAAVPTLACAAAALALLAYATAVLARASAHAGGAATTT
ncbi:hypothetical protein E2C00_32185 [Streptomyces sp. WAC05374]|nr:hypothetical protein EF905_29010 [Streptomyces sp. WAC05374]TDF42916.1 hypothetical protein E2B92_20910 [Streptomyces sp. WAC05374]TDF47758.1 hypothetical protein E2C00_32185 [Streptomyces sp. WAC05374]TDF48970.1 hypothetical protein E2C02_28155 [Streptomyces sp. WAC05374]